MTNRYNFVLSSKEIDNAHVIHDCIIPEYETDDLYIIGGENVYRQYIDHCNQILLSTMDLYCDGDSFFPEVPANFKLSETINHGNFIVEKYIKC